MTQMAFQLFDKIGLSFDKVRPKIGITSVITSTSKKNNEEHTPNNHQEMDIEDRKEEDQEEMSKDGGAKITTKVKRSTESQHL